MPTVMTLQGVDDAIDGIGRAGASVPRRRWIRSESKALPWYDLWTGASSSHLPGTGAMPAALEDMVESGTAQVVGHCQADWAPVWAEHRTVSGLRPFASACHAESVSWKPVRALTQAELERLASDQGMVLGDFVSWLKQRNPLVAGAIVLGLSLTTGVVLGSLVVAVLGDKSKEPHQTSFGGARGRGRRRRR